MATQNPGKPNTRANQKTREIIKCRWARRDLALGPEMPRDSPYTLEGNRASFSPSSGGALQPDSDPSEAATVLPPNGPTDPPPHPATSAHSPRPHSPRSNPTPASSDLAPPASPPRPPRTERWRCHTTSLTGTADYY
jgi:hypothetical protein